jgi:predicted MFS family arabinose efflux permease
LLVARMVTGGFGGVIGSVVFAITTDLFPFEMRGRVMGFVQTAFAASLVLGIPAGLFLTNLWGWHAPFIMIVAVSAVVGVVILLRLRPIDGHLRAPETTAAPARCATCGPRSASLATSRRSPRRRCSAPAASC